MYIAIFKIVYLYISDGGTAYKGEGRVLPTITLGVDAYALPFNQQIFVGS